jgi:hypothetical protein
VKRLICYWRTLLEIDTLVMALTEFGAAYVAHDYREQKPRVRGNKLYETLKCQTCGTKSVSWRLL